VGWREEKQGVRGRSPRVQATPPPTTFMPIPNGAQQRTVTRQAIDVLTIQEGAEANNKFTPLCLMKHAKKSIPTMFKHFASPMVHPIMGKTISSYKKLMNDPATAKVWQTAFGKDFGGMAQGDKKTGQKGTNAMFVMNHDKLAHVLLAGKNSRLRIQWLIIDRKRKIPVGFK
jgi:hypothetical protein